jgi:PAS domain S-box-containing protein
MIVAGSYDSYLVTLSIVVASLASYTALDLGGRIRVSSGLTRMAWLATAAIAMGGGIWSMHFIAMLAFLMPMDVSFGVGLTVLSLIIAIGVTGAGFYVIGTRRATSLQLVLAGLFMGTGIVGMHYTGMAAMHVGLQLSYDPLFVALSVFIAIAASIAALWLSFRNSAIWQRALAAIVMGFAISGMHYTGMAAAVFTAHAGHQAAHGAAPDAAASLAQTSLAVSIAAITFLILTLSLVASLFDRRFAVLAQRDAALLRESEEQMRKLYRETPLPLHSLGPDARIATVSEAWLGLLGFRREEVIGEFLTEFMTPESRYRHERAAWPSLQRGEEIQEFECQLVHKSGKILDVLYSARGQWHGDGTIHILGGLIDVTARKKAETALAQSQRLEAIGKLTGGVAHDFNNLLMVVSGATERLRRAAPEVATQPLNMIATAVKRGQTLTGHLLSFARRQTLESRPVDLAELLPHVSEMLKRSLRGDIEIRTSGGESPCWVHVDVGELELAVLNLGVNARDAMPGDGILSLTLRKMRLTGEVEFEGLRGDFVVVEMRDTGVGIAAEMLPRVFEPFFTTKGARGTGLGLSQVYGFARQSGGAAIVRSKLGRGTTVSILLPEIGEQDVQRERREMPAAAKRHEGAGTVLIVEDNEEVAAVSSDYLEQLGYVVERSSSGADALHKLRSGRSFDLVFSDLLMPGSVGGLELARIVRERHPELPILLTSGYSDKAQDAVHEGFPLVHKPFDIGRLSAAISDVIPREHDGRTRELAVAAGSS